MVLHVVLGYTYNVYIILFYDHIKYFSGNNVAIIISTWPTSDVDFNLQVKVWYVTLCLEKGTHLPFSLEWFHLLAPSCKSGIPYGLFNAP